MSLEKNVLNELSRMRARIQELEQLVIRHSGNQHVPKEKGPTSSAPPSVNQHTRSQASAKAKNHPSTEYFKDSSIIDVRNHSGSVLGWVGAFCFLLGSSFLIKLAIDSGWLTPLRQVCMAAMLGTSLVGVGLWQKGKDHSFFSILPATGLSILYIAVFGARLMYGMISPEVTVLLVSLIAMMSLYLYIYLGQFLFIVASVLGAYVCPLLLQQTQVDALGLMSFFLVWDVVFVVMSVWQRSRAILLLASYAALFSFSLPLVSVSMPDQQLLMVCIFQFIQFFVFALGVAKHSLNSEESIGQEIWAFAPLLTFFYGLQYYFLHQYAPSLAPWIALGFATVVLILAVVTQQRLKAPLLAVGQLAWGFWGLVFYHAVYIELLSGIWPAWFSTALFLCVLIFTGVRSWLTRHKTLWVWIGLMIIQGYGMVLLETVSSMPMESWIIMGGIYFAGAMVIFVQQTQLAEVTNKAAWKVILVAGYIQLLVAWVRLAQEISSIWSSLSPRFTVSVFWGLSALGILMWSHRLRHKPLAYSSMFIFAISILKVLLLDVSSAGPVVRIVCLFLLGGVLFAGGYLYRQIDQWTVKPAQ